MTDDYLICKAFEINLFSDYWDSLTFFFIRSIMLFFVRSCQIRFGLNAIQWIIVESSKWNLIFTRSKQSMWHVVRTNLKNFEKSFFLIYPVWFGEGRSGVVVGRLVWCLRLSWNYERHLISNSILKSEQIPKILLETNANQTEFGHKTSHPISSTSLISFTIPAHRTNKTIDCCFTWKVHWRFVQIDSQLWAPETPVAGQCCTAAGQST